MAVLVRADDFGYCQGVNRGILLAIEKGVINNVGMMVNMPYVKEAFESVKDKDICLGLHVNISVGTPICEVSQIDSLVDGCHFKSSKIYRSASQDFVDLKQAILEVQAQVDTFIQYAGFKPMYMDFHAVFSANFTKACEIVARQNDILFVGMSEKSIDVYVSDEQSDESCLKEFDSFIKNHKKDDVLIVYHPGFVDEDLLQSSSLTTKREKDVSFLASCILKDYLTKENICLFRIDQLKREDS